MICRFAIIFLNKTKKMKKTVTTLLTAILLISVYSCSKNSSSSTNTQVLSTNQTSVAGTVENFTNVNANRLGGQNSVTFQATTTGSPSDLISFTVTGNGATTTVLATGKYTASNTASINFSATLANKNYSNNYGDAANYVNITENDTLLVGTYNANVYSSDSNKLKTLIGNFRCKIQ